MVDKDITLEHLLIHTSGFIADNPLADYQKGPKVAWEKLFALNPTNPLRSRFTYSDVNYLLLGKVVEEISGMKLDEFTRKHIFGPLGMKETGFLPGPELRRRAAPTEQREAGAPADPVHLHVLHHGPSRPPRPAGADQSHPVAGGSEPPEDLEQVNLRPTRVHADRDGSPIPTLDPRTGPEGP